MVPCKTSKRQVGLQRSHQKCPKRPNTANKEIFKGDGSLDALMGEAQRVLDSYLSGFLMEPIRDNEDFKGAVRNVKNSQKGKRGQKGDFHRRRQSLRTFFKVMGDNQSVLDSSYVTVPGGTKQRQLGIYNL